MSMLGEQIARTIDKNIRAHQMLVDAYQALRRHVLINKGAVEQQATDACNVAIDAARVLIEEARVEIEGPGLGSAKCNVGSGGTMSGRVSHDRPNGREVFRETTGAGGHPPRPDIGTLFEGTREVRGSGHDPCLMKQKHSPDDRYILSRTGQDKLFFVPATNGGWRRNVLQVDAHPSGTVTHILFETVAFSSKGQRFINAACLDDGAVLRMFAGRKS